MSRSYKKVPCCKDYNRGMKKCANRYLRRNYLDIPSGRAYKKLFCSYDICDYKFLNSFSSYKKGLSIMEIESIRIRNCIKCGIKIIRGNRQTLFIA